MHSPPRPLPAAKLSCTALLCLALMLSGCRSKGPRIDSDVQLSIHKEAALAYYENGQLDRAEDQALRGIGIDRQDTSLRLMLGWIYLRRGTTESLYKARGVFEDFAKNEEPRADLGLGETLERLGRVHQETADSIDKGERFASGGDPERTSRKLREDARQLFSDARAAYQRVLDRQPDNLKALNGMQRAHSLEGNYAASLEYSNKLIEVASSERDALRTSLADPERILTDRSEDGLREVARTTENLLAETHFFAYSLALALDRKQEALEHLNQTVEMRPKLTEAWSRRAQLNFDLGHFAQTVADVTQFVKLSDKPFDDPDIRQAWQLKHDAEQAMH